MKFPNGKNKIVGEKKRKKMQMKKEIEKIINFIK